MEYLLFVVYLVGFAWLVTRIRFFTKSGLSRSQLIILFLLKVMAGIFYGWIGIYYGGLAQMWDTWGFHTLGVEQSHLLYNNPKEYFTNIFRDPYQSGIYRFLDSNDSFWNDLKGNVFIKILSVFDLVSLGNYYINIIFYSFFTLFGPIAIYRVMCDYFNRKNFAMLLATFLLPSFLYWNSGIHKEGLIFTGIALIIYCVYFGLKQKRFGIKRIICTIVGLLLVLTLRNFLIVILIPALFAWLLAARWPKYGLAIFCSLYLLFGILFFTARYISPRFDFPQAVVNKQTEFLKLKGSTTIPINKLQPTAVSFLENTPQAITLSVLRPYPGDVRHILSLAAAIEIDLLLLLFILFLIFHKNGLASRNLLYFCLFFSFSVLLAIGFSVNNLGAIVRYRSIVLPLLIIPMAALTDWERIGKVFFKNIRNKNNITNTT